MGDPNEQFERLSQVFTKDQELIKELKEAISDLHSVLREDEWNQLDPQTRRVCLAVHDELHHG